MKKYLKIIVSCFAFAIISTPIIAQADDLDTIKKLVSGGNYDAALKPAQDYANLNPNNYQSHYYLALTLYGLNRNKESLESANKAFQLASDAVKPTIQKLIDKLTIVDKSQEATGDADEAWNAGLFAKAARLYEDAWFKNPTDFQGALRAAQTFDKMGEFERALILYQQLSRKAPNGKELDQAKNFLNSNYKEIDDLSAKLAIDSRVAIASKDYEKAVSILGKLRKLDPTFNQRFLLISIEAAKGNEAEVVKAFAQLLKQKAKLSELEIFFRNLPKGGQYISSPDIALLFEDAIGLNEYRIIKGKVLEAHLGKGDCFYLCPPMKLVANSEFVMGSPVNNLGMQTLGVMVSPWLKKHEKDRLFMWPQTKINFGRDVVYSVNPISLEHYRYCVVSGACADTNSIYYSNALTLEWKDSPNWETVELNYDEALKYTIWLSKVTNRNFKIISAAEWEFTCKLGLQSTQYEWVADDYREKNKDRPKDGTAYVWSGATYKEIRNSANGCFEYQGDYKTKTAPFRIVEQK